MNCGVSNRQELPAEGPLVCHPKAFHFQELLHDIPSATVSPLFVGDVTCNGFYLRSGIPRTARQTASAQYREYHHLHIEFLHPAGRSGRGSRDNRVS
jgi:hypothetical protein